MELESDGRWGRCGFWGMNSDLCGVHLGRRGREVMEGNKVVIGIKWGRGGRRRWCRSWWGCVLRGYVVVKVIVDGLMMSSVMLWPPGGECSPIKEPGYCADWAWHVGNVDSGLLDTTDHADLWESTCCWYVGMALYEVVACWAVSGMEGNVLLEDF